MTESPRQGLGEFAKITEFLGVGGGAVVPNSRCCNAIPGSYSYSNSSRPSPWTWELVSELWSSSRSSLMIRFNLGSGKTTIRVLFVMNFQSSENSLDPPPGSGFSAILLQNQAIFKHVTPNLKPSSTGVSFWDTDAHFEHVFLNNQNPGQNQVIDFEIASIKWRVLTARKAWLLKAKGLN